MPVYRAGGSSSIPAPSRSQSPRSSDQRRETELWYNPFSENPDPGFRFQGACVSVMVAKSKSAHHFHGAIQFSLRKLGKAEKLFLEH